MKREDGERLAREYQVTFMETSAKTGLNVDLAFLAVARYNVCINNDYELEKIRLILSIPKNNPKKNRIIHLI